ncbi:MAG: peptide-methionine (S)-S-oxide reductase MsrA [Phaeodactylibacter sp.]|nr:peptide-methionine (S)-S-oxide reductase MsrA [Phaeodactylibacter sp.]MCB9277007.1 peptide-methionine (S)-S-oxide reductase MsrA [Lewinellaceae bacterium]
MLHHAFTLLLTLALASSAGRAQGVQTKTAKTAIPGVEEHADTKLDTATLGGGCFWCVEAIYQDVRGVVNVVSGYSGGTAETADYETVCRGRTDHAEVVQATFDPKVIAYEEILEIFWATHDPTTKNRQGNDVGRQYRSVIFYHNDEQKAIAERSKAEVAPQLWKKRIVTEISPFTGFWVAEDYHQDYYNKVGVRNPYCTFVITPKVEKFRKAFKDKLKD